MIKIGDIVKDIRNDSLTYTHGLVKKIENDRVYCLWNNSLESVKRNIFLNTDLLWCDYKYLEVVDLGVKNIKVYGISKFMDSLALRK